MTAREHVPGVIAALDLPQSAKRLGSGRFFELNPLPDPGAWRAIADPEARLRRALGELYEYYARHESLIANVSRDGEVHAATGEANAQRLGPRIEAMRETLAEGLVAGRNRRRVMAALDLALDFQSWRTLVRTNRLRKGEAAGLMARTVACAARAS